MSHETALKALAFNYLNNKYNIKKQIKRKTTVKV